MKRFIAIGSILFILAVTVWYFCLYASPLVISPETTYITAPLMPDGKRIDYFRAWEERAYPPEMKTDDNGYRVLVRAIGDTTEYYASEWDSVEARMIRYDHDPEPFRLQVYEKLGLNPNIPPMLKIETPDIFMGRYVKEHPASAEQWQWNNQRRIGMPWTFKDFPALQGWLAENEAGLNLLGEAVRKPVFRAPEVRVNFASFWNSSATPMIFREFARALSARAYYRIGIGNIDGAIEDIITCYLLARHVGKHGTHDDYLVGIAIEGMAASIHVGANPAAPPNRTQLQRLFDAIRSLPPSQKLEDCLEAERFFALRVLQEYAFGEKPDFFWGPEYGVWCADVDWNAIFREVNSTFDAIIAGEEYGENIIQRWGRILTEEERRSPELPMRATAQERTEVALAVLGTRLIPTTQASPRADQRRQCAENLKLLTLALLLYEKDHGKLPDGDWREAVKPYLAGTPATRGDVEEAGVPAKYFRCPSHPGLADDETTYAMIRRESGVTPATPYTLLLVEVLPPMKMTGNDGAIPTALARFNQPEGLSSNHSGGIVVSYRSGAVAFISESMSTDKLQSLIDGTSDTPW